MSNTVRWTAEQYAAHMGGAAKPKSVIPTKPQGKKRLQALGRLADGVMNKTEARYAAHLEAEKLAGRVKWFCFESVKLKLAKNTHVTVDFFVLTGDDRLEAHDVKGARVIVEDDALCKIKVAASLFPWPFKFVYPRKGGGWDVEEF
jgi:hypothetical protein